MRDVNSGERRIERALRGEPMRSVPPHLFGRIRARIQVLSIIREERRRFGGSLLALAFLLLAVVGAGAFLAAFPEHIEKLCQRQPGLIGYSDYISTWLPTSVVRLAGILLMVTGVPAGLMLVNLLRQVGWPDRLSGQSD